MRASERHILRIFVFYVLSLPVLNMNTNSLFNNGFNSSSKDSDLDAQATSQIKLQYKHYTSAVRRQPQYPASQPFPCPTGPGSPGGRSPKIPRSVHRLRPGDIDVIGAMGDSLIAGNGALEEFAIGSIIEHRGVSWCAGGQGNWREYLTLPNILKEFNPNITGYSVGRGEFLSPNSRLNVAFPVSASQDALKQAMLLVARMKNDPTIDFKKHWKLITILFGANDLCSLQCFNPVKGSPIQYQRYMKEALDYLHKNSPRTFVNLIPAIDVSVSVRIRRTPMCLFLHTLFCNCFHKGGREFEDITKLVQQYQKSLQLLISSGRYDTREDFTVVVQPFIRFLNAPKDRTGKRKEAIHISYITHDCFHFSQKGHALAANLLWNNMLEPEWHKSEYLPNYILETFHCPTEYTPFLFTNINSKIFAETGSQI